MEDSERAGAFADVRAKARRREQINREIAAASGLWPILTILAALSLINTMVAPFATPPFPMWVRGLTAAGTIMFSGATLFFVLTKRSLEKQLKKLP